ncbi:MAG: hypothetical protein Q8P15_00090 [Nanoarchaeota archaeon]|nr:hypothetical protein [Nanoarchaeota archaeon]
MKREEVINFGFASAMNGKSVFNKNCEISKAGYKGAYEALRRAYENALNKPKKDLVEKLNKNNVSK